MNEKERLKQFAHEAPLEAGVYIMKDADGRIIYVGKARILRNRLSSYFAGVKDIKTMTLLRRAASIETIITADEYEALLLENTLIKQHSPRYNLKLTDGKTYPVIRLSAGPWPRVFRTRHIVEDGSSYFGPFPNVGAVDEMLAVIDRSFPLRKCRVLRKRRGPCMYYHIGRCSAPCCGKISEEEYAVEAGRVRKLLSGETGPLLAELEEAMRREAAALRFERAAALRNAVRAVESLSSASSVVDFDPQGRDYIAWAAEGLFSVWSVFSMRGGKLTGRELYRTRTASEDEESLETFIASYYNGERLPPPQVFIDSKAPEGLPRLKRWIKESFDIEPDLVFCGADAEDPAVSSGIDSAIKRHAAVIAMVRQNAAEELRRWLRERGAGPALEELAAVLKLRARPELIEGFDIAQLDGKHPVASLISFKDGIPDRKNYRHFKLRSVIGVVDDFAAMREAVNRRYTRQLRENNELPDLILIDGGIGQVNAAKGVLDELGIACDVVGLAKRDEELWLPNASQPLRLSRRSEALKVLQHVRDETHRFATGLNQRLRSKDLHLDILESVEGIGPARAAALIQAFGGLEGIAAAEPEAIAEACGSGSPASRAVRAAARLALQKAASAKGSVSRRKSGAAGDLAASLAQAALDDEAGELAGLAAESEEDYR